ncbi:MAG: protein kinase [Deltaproteobacteria bacterium]|nr:protein kinase [Deltaproteobacteria bacterium]
MPTAGEYGRVFGERFQTVAMIKGGGPVSVYVGKELASGADVVVKTVALSQLQSARSRRLLHEAALLATIRSPHIAPLLAYGRDRESLYLVTPRIPGISLADRIGFGPLSVPEVVAVARSLCEALRSVHDQGVVHRDLKPSNIIVNKTAPIQGSTLIDFGLATNLLQQHEAREEPVGTVRYMAPEVAGLIPRAVDARADLYALGIVLFECVTGHPPFAATTVNDLLRKHASADVPPIESPNEPIPSALSEIIRRLLRKDPCDRYQSADAVTYDLEQLAARLAAGEREPALVIGTRDRRTTLAEPAFVGRSDSLSALADALAEAEAGRAALVFVEGESGSGKSRLLHEFSRHPSTQRAVTFWGQGVDQSAARPYQLLDGVISGITSTLCDDGDFAHHVAVALGEDAAPVVAAFPELAAPLAQDSSPDATPEAFGEARTTGALVKLLDALGRPDEPAIVFVDDAQWGDSQSFGLLRAWHERAPQQSRVMIVVAYRTEEVPADHALREMESATRLCVARLSANDTKVLVVSMAGPVPDEALSFVADLSEGNPFFAVALVGGLVESGALYKTPAGWSIDAAAFKESRTSRRAAAFLRRRLEHLGDDLVETISLAAVLGKTFSIDHVAELGALPRREVVARIENCRRRHIVWRDRAVPTRFTFAHDKIREALLERMPPRTRTNIHRRAALQLTFAESDRDFELAYHWYSAGESTNALPYAVAAAKKSRAKYALETAERYYRMAALGAADADAETQLRVNEGLGDVLTLRGRYDEAELYLKTARTLATSPESRARSAFKLGDLAFKRGDVKLSGVALESALGELGRRVPRSPFALAIRFLWEVVVQTAHTLFPRWFVARRQRSGASRDVLAMRIYSRLAHVYWFQSGKVACLWSHLRGMNLAEVYAPSLELAQSYSEHAPAMTMIPWFRRGRAYVERSFSIRKSLGDAWGQGQSLHFNGVVLYAESRFSESLAKCTEAARILDRMGDRWEVNTASWHIALCHYRMGNLREAVEMAQKVHAAGKEIGDRQAAGIALGIWSKASNGRVPRALVAAELAKPSDDVHTMAELLQADAVRLIVAGTPAKAVACLDRAQALIEKKGLKQEYVAPVLPWLATALRKLLETIPEYQPELKRKTLTRAWRIARRALRLAQSFQNNLPHALRECAAIEVLRDHAENADELFAESRRVATAQGARYELALTRALEADISASRGVQGADERRLRRRAELEEMWSSAMLDVTEAGAAAAVPTISLTDRFDTIVDAGRRIASAITRPAIWAATRDAALLLLRGDHCVVVFDKQPRDTSDDPRFVLDRVLTFGPDAQGFPTHSQALVDQAIAERRPVTLTHLGAEALTDSVVLSRARSALCAPILVRGKVGGCFYVTHREVEAFFGAEEERIAAFIATLAGAALENAEGFAELEELYKSVEQLVEERTRELRVSNRELEASLKSLHETQEELFHAGKLAAVGTLVAGLSHELNNPIGIIHGFAETLLKQTTAGTPFAKGLSAIVRESERCGDLVTALLNYSRHDRVRRTAVLPKDLVQHAKQIAAAEAKNRGVSLVVSTLPETLPELEVVPAEIESAILNLIHNAIDASPQAGVVEVGARESEWEGARGVEVSVSDRGSGIPADVLPRIFEPFFTTKPVGKGTGLGLSLTHRIVEAHEGNLRVESLPGLGTKFFMWLPSDRKGNIKSKEC